MGESGWPPVLLLKIMAMEESTTNIQFSDWEEFRWYWDAVSSSLLLLLNWLDGKMLGTESPAWAG